MTFNPHHVGLFFGQDNIEVAQSHRDKAPVQWAWTWLTAETGVTIRQRLTPTYENKKATTPVVRDPVDALSATLVSAYRYRFGGEDAPAREVVQALQSGIGFESSDTFLQTVQTAIAGAQLFEMVRDHASLKPLEGQWLQTFAEHIQTLLAYETVQAVDSHWQDTLRVVAGVVLENATYFEQGVTHLHATIDTIHPEGYLKPVVEGNDEGTLWRMMMSVSALTLGAEAATQAGANVWDYENRGVGIGTSATYLVYYYFYPDKWKWFAGFTTDYTRELFIQHGAFIEMAAYRATLRGVDILLDDQRPLFSPYHGGLTTLSHGLKPSNLPKKKKWLWSLGD